MRQLALLLMPLFLLFSCDNDELTKQELEINRDIELYVYYEPENSLNESFFPDYKAKVYVYFDLILNEPFTIEGNGVIRITKTEQLINPMQASSVNKDGYLNITPLYADKTTLVIVESKYYSGIFAKTSFYNCKEKNIATFKFTKHIIAN